MKIFPGIIDRIYLWNVGKDISRKIENYLKNIYEFKNSFFYNFLRNTDGNLNVVTFRLNETKSSQALYGN